MTPSALYLHAGMTLESPDYAIMPMGAIGCVNLLAQRGWRVSGVNVAMEVSLDPAFRLVTALSEMNAPDLVLVDLHWYMTSAGAVSAARVVAEVFPSAHILVGGMTANYFTDQLFDFLPPGSAVAVGDAEIAVREVAENLEAGIWDPSSANIATAANRHPALIQLDDETFEALDFTNISWLRHADSYWQTDIHGFDAANPRRFWLEVGRGCMYNCGMCGGGVQSHRRLSLLTRTRYRSRTRIVSDLRVLRDMGVEQVALSHDIFALQHPDIPSLLGPEVAELELGILHEFWNLPDAAVVEDMFATFDSSQSEVALSPESGSEFVRYRNFPNKNFSNDQFVRTLQLFQDRDLIIEVFFAANLPFETHESWSDTLDLVSSCTAAFGLDNLRMYAGFLTIDPGSPMWEHPERFGVTREFEGFADYLNMTAKGVRLPGYQTSGLSVADLRSSLDAFRAHAEHLARVGHV